ncbi:type IV pilus assembly protein PilM [Acetivibrio straminisolvens]|jgi:type IV pilus assembly protein PilM|nr:type IV pilus assembly protein PilM [Acetivibrio straminisolvens]
MLLPFLRNNYLSIDVGFRNIKVVEVAVNRNNEVYINNFGIAPTPLNCIKNGVIKNVDAVSSEISRIIRENKMKVKKSKIVMSGTSIISRVFMIEKVPGKDIDELVYNEIVSNMPINPDEHKIDYKILQELKEDNVEKIKVFVTAVRKSIINSYIDVLFELGLKPVSVDIPANSTAKFFNRDIKVSIDNVKFVNPNKSQLNKDAFAVIDFGSETTIINILRNKILEFNKVILTGSTNLDDAIAKNMRKSIIEAERLKKLYGISVPPHHSTNEEHMKVYRTLKEVVDKLLNQIYMCLTFYEARCYGVKVGKIFIIGGGSLLKGLADYMEQVLQIPVYPVGLLDIDGIDINKNLNSDKLNFLVNAVGITL